MSNTQGSFSAYFEVDPDPDHREQLRANGDKLTSTGRDKPGEQVRIEFHAAVPNATLGAIFTVSSPFLYDPDPERVIIRNRIVNLNNCQLSENACKGEVKAQIMIDGLEQNEGQAKKMGELIEKLNHEVQNHKFNSHCTAWR
jgi:hypothetical protein